MIGAALALTLVLAGGIDSYEAGLRHLDEGRFRVALSLFEGLDDPAERRRGAAEVYWRAGDPSRALEEAEEGLLLEPGSAPLAYRATASALWTGDVELAAGHLARLLEILSDVNWEPDVRQAWDSGARTFEEEIERRRAIRAARDTALVRAQWTGVSLLGLLLGLGVVFARSKSPGN